MNDRNPSAPHFRCAAISGVGLLGGSLGLALRSRELADRVIGIGRSARRLAPAVERGAIDSYSLNLAAGCAEADLIVLCGPVAVILDQLPEVLAAAPPGALVSDVGSTKRSIVERAARLARADVAFVGSHPIAGSEKTGVEHASAELFQGATCILTPDISTPDEALERARALWQAVGMQVLDLLPARHDQLLAVVSHLPHLVASALVAQAERRAGDHLEILRAVAGPGFRDATRIAMGSAALWTDILEDNRVAVTQCLDTLIEILDEVRENLEGGEAAHRQRVEEFLDSAARLRREFNR